MPVVPDERKYQSGLVRFILNGFKSHHGRATESVLVIDEINEIGGISNQIGHEIYP